jgi:hypothetical protein
MQLDGSGRKGGKWCAAIRGDRGELDWVQFNSSCWDGSGEVYDGQVPLTNVMVLVPGSDTDDVVFDFCINSIEPV